MALFRETDGTVVWQEKETLYATRSGPNRKKTFTLTTVLPCPREGKKKKCSSLWESTEKKGEGAIPTGKNASFPGDHATGGLAHKNSKG